MGKLLTCLILACAIVTSVYAEPFKANGTIEALFSPRGGCTEAIVREIGGARNKILVQAYSFTSTQIAKALIEANKRGVKIEAVLDKSQRRGKYTSATFLANSGIAVYIDDSHAIAHNKVIVVDGRTLITGSFNFTKAAEEKNAENLLIIKGNQPLIERYIANIQEHKNHAVPYR